MEYARLLEDINAYWAYDRDKQKFSPPYSRQVIVLIWKKVKDIFKLIVT